MKIVNSHCRCLLLLLVSLLVAGCSNKEKIVLVPVEGKLMLDGKPVPLAKIDFMPEFRGHGAESNSFAITDDNGKFVLLFGGGEPGCAVATHRVVINEAPVGGDMRGQDEASQNRLAAYNRTLKNRPLPTSYQTYTSTPLKIDITGEKKDLVVEMHR